METYSRRQWLLAVGSTAAVSSLRLHAALDQKPMKGAFIIMATPYSRDKQVDYEDLVREVDFMHRGRVQGMVWPQFASEYPHLNTEERLKGMEVLAKASRGKIPALVLGVQADTTEEMLEFARHAESLQPDAMIAMPPKKAKSLDDYRHYYRSLCKTTDRPVFIQTTGGAPDIEPTVDFIVELARELPNFGYVKEEYAPATERMIEMAKYRPDVIKSVFGGSAGRAWTYEMRLGLDGTMPGYPYPDVYALLWELHQQNKREKIREVFSKLLLMINTNRQIPGTRAYMMKKRGVFKTTVSRRRDFTYTREQIEEIEFNFEALKPYLRA